MRINVLLSPLNAEELYFTGKNCVVIDVLRATSVISTALNNGAKEIIPVGSIEFAMKISGSFFGGHRLLAGERNTKKIDGFSLGNSPLEYDKSTVEGKSIVLFTTNGSKAIVKAKFSELLVTCSFINLGAVVDYFSSFEKDLEILCAGDHGRFSLEDTICAGNLIKEIQRKNSTVELTDSARSSLALCDAFGSDINQMLHETEHGKLLIQNGFGEDIKACAEVSTMKVLPFFSEGVIKKLEVE